MPSKRLVPTAVVCALLALGATACNDDKSGSDTAAAAPAVSAAPSKSPVPTLAVDTLTGKEIEAKAKAAMTALTSLHVKGQIASKDGKISLDLAADKQGNCTGSVGVGGTGKAEILHTGEKTWMKPDAEFWKAIGTKEGGSAKEVAAATELFKGRYLLIPADDTESGASDFAAMCGLIEALTSDDSADSKVEKGAAGTTNGFKTFSLTATDADGEKSTLYVATEGKPYLVRMEQTEGSEPGEMNFSDFDKPLTVTAPPADEVIDMSVFTEKVKKKA